MGVGTFGPRVGATGTVEDARALMASANKRLADAVVAEAAAKAALDAHDHAHRHASEALALRERTLKGERDRFEANTLASTAQLEGMLEEATKRQQRAVQAEKDNAVLLAARSEMLDARVADLDARHAELNARAADLEARETALVQRIELANQPKPSWLKRVTRRLKRR
jgi:hypothetical protein